MTVGYSVAEVNRIRQVMGRRMRQSARDIPQVTLHASADAGPLAAAPTSGAGPRVTVTAHLLVAVARTLPHHPRVNSCVVDGEVRLMSQVNLGVAAATRDGLVVPVIHDAAALGPVEMATRLGHLRQRADAGRLLMEDLVDATFTVSNLGPYGVGHFTPLVNPPQVAILGVGAICDRLAPTVDGPRVVRELPLSLTFDHSTLDGAEAASFLRDLVQSIAD